MTKIKNTKQNIRARKRKKEIMEEKEEIKYYPKYPRHSYPENEKWKKIKIL